MHKAQPTPVVAALLTSNTRILLAQRPPNDQNPNKWEFPGGKVEPGETPKQALRRELTEEFSIDAKVGDLLGEVVHQYPHITIRLMAYRVENWRGDLTPCEHQAVAWVLPEDLATFDLAKADRILVRVMSRSQRNSDEE